MEDYAFHPVANLFPMMAPEEASRLAKDIAAKGLLDPIALCKGKILDGRNRYEACRTTGTSPLFVTVDPADPVAYVLSHNLHRRHLSVSQRAMVAARVRDFYDQQARERQAKTRKRGNRPVPARLPGREKGDARDRAGRAMNVGGTSVDRATKVLKSGNDNLISQVERGEKTVTAAAREVDPNRVKRLRLRLTMGMRYARMAVAQLEKINEKDTERHEAFAYVIQWIGEHA